MINKAQAHKPHVKFESSENHFAPPVVSQGDKPPNHPLFFLLAKLPLATEGSQAMAVSFGLHCHEEARVA